MEAEFDTVAEWTAKVAADLGPDYHIPAGCRGSGSPAALDWLIEHTELAAGLRLLDCGAGVGGPAAYAAQAVSVHPVLVEPEAGACRAAHTLFGHPVLQAQAAALPLADNGFDAAWCLGVLCTTPNQLGLLQELHRVVRPGGRIGLLAFVAHREIPREEFDGNHFPTPERLTQLVDAAHLIVEQQLCTADLPAIPDGWNERVAAVDEALADRYGHKRAWQLAEEQSGKIGDLLGDGGLTGELLILRHE
ncbi:class I SAM-dependent methyltransferase [Mycolicibacterium goodii]|uniref:SAM-dependent methyltransferase n=1 Tax=Mycolicibacterium goodii TaxID=134601 RepID=A0A0K0X1S8_MYCGD|nr:SAM-dependent methyltransferase [Mycolicibacterium goodii]